MSTGEDAVDEPTTRFRLDIAYDGTAFSGWTRQPDLRTVQGDLEEALKTVFGRVGPPPALTVAGRTDAGVHALGQVAHVDLTDRQIAVLQRRRGKLPPATDAASTLRRRLNGIAGLETDVYVSRASVAPSGFDARFSAIWRRYEYRVADNLGLRDPLARNRTVWYPATLGVDAMDAAASTLVGLHDFGTFCKPREGATTIRTLQDFRWSRLPDGVLLASVKADAFCHSMVRALVGASISVGEGKLDPSQLVVLRDRLERTSDFRVAPARGLTLMQVGYPEDAGLALRAEQTRARRASV
ncbi:tRNA pseudouridine(38-40) synthase TruA [Lacisediminihabitans changchengi]|uniref:tRNA pseudouridine synthase A n=1 Tax=Lacisediminihabitans changchengi TaxID=2787634 RepID=A0A934W4K2_9MICO|nr:tRNA pseudouridine(38-40) synthase TruA [Lacisediminihabitans changchengi]MBK4348364.1 tRNA pseudouridine(38-40) synthase TruA [Lacisediminihabitans changchengi]